MERIHFVVTVEVVTLLREEKKVVFFLFLQLYADLIALEPSRNPIYS